MVHVNHRFGWLAFVLMAFVSGPVLQAQTAREILVQAILEEDAAQKRQLIGSLAGKPDESIKTLLEAWREDALFIHEATIGDKTVKTPVHLVGEKDAKDAQAAIRVDDGKPFLDASGQPARLVGADLVAVEHNSALRQSMKPVFDLIALVAAEPQKRIRAIEGMGQGQDPEKLPALKLRLTQETDPRVKAKLREAIAFIQLKDADDAVKLAALKEIKELQTLASSDFVAAALKEAKAANKPTLVQAAEQARIAIESHRSAVDFSGTLFRGVSHGSILLVIALGLAITFGLMGVINMAHGEMIAVGAYTTYIVQNIFGNGVTIPFFGFSLAFPGMNLEGSAYQWYFIAALPISFVTAALVGVALERSVIRFLYRRPLESLLATWGVSLVLQQGFRLMFGANNVQVSSPTYLSGSWIVNDVGLGYNRLFVIGFAIMIVLGVWLVLTKTPLGLFMRAVMQNRAMASCMGVRTERVNMFTFALGSGLAGLAGAFVSQIANVGPSLGQAYVVDSFMVVVLGGVGNLVGTVISAFGIGGIDQIFQQYLPTWFSGLGWVPRIGNFLQNLGQDSAVLGKILVLFGIILFLQWRPAGIFVTRSRSLEG